MIAATLLHKPLNLNRHFRTFPARHPAPCTPRLACCVLHQAKYFAPAPYCTSIDDLYELSFLADSMTKSTESENARKAALYRKDTDKLIPREKLPDELQKLVDDEDSIIEQIYDGTFVFGHMWHWAALSSIDCRPGPHQLQNHPFVTQHTPVAYEPFSSVPTGMSPTPPISGSRFVLSPIHGSSREHMAYRGHTWSVMSVTKATRLTSQINKLDTLSLQEWYPQGHGMDRIP